ncbi:MAG TPA: (5-formylfuran-3-yl)methyl phosphate synthase [Caulifigura sp.]|nr:(5-formylfuran-3-yl)methyl phosphate synthase [Caulifigura sp.]
MPVSLLRTGVEPPRLLVSVQSAQEASDAIDGGADVVDVKDPSRGSLGFAGPETIGLIDGAGRPVTAALGECLEWLFETPFVPGQVSMVKLGLAGLRGSDWLGEWLRVRQRIDQNRPLTWIAVGYADAMAADAPDVRAIAAAATKTGCAGLLLDTFDKRGGRLTELISDDELIGLADLMHTAGLFLAVAGRLNLEDVSRLAKLPVDVVAVRSAACADGERRGRIARERVEACREALGHAAACKQAG